MASSLCDNGSSKPFDGQILTGRQRGHDACDRRSADPLKPPNRMAAMWEFCRHRRLEAAANVSRRAKFPDLREKTGNFIEIGPIAHACRKHLYGVRGETHS